MQVRSNNPIPFKSSVALLTILICLEGIFHGVFAGEQLSLSANLSPTRVSVGETAILSIAVNGARSAEVKLPAQENLVFHRRGQSIKRQIINGSFSSSVTITYVIQAEKEGKYTIPPISVHVDNEVLKTVPLPLEVVSAAAVAQNPAPASSGDSEKARDKIAFMTIEGLPDKGYRGQILPVKIKAYFREGVRAEIDKLPEIVGASFVLSPLENEPVQTKELYDGRSYLVVSWEASTSAIKEGKHSFQIKLDANLLIPRKKTRSPLGRDPFFDDDFFSGFFGTIEKKDVTLTTPEHPVAITPLPQKGKPPGFSGAIGNFTFKAKAAPLEIEVGEPLTLTMTISGTGNFDRVSAPEFPDNQNWKTYSPVSRYENQSTSYEGKKIFEQAIVPTNNTPQFVPELSFSYFDPLQHTYVTVSTEPMPIKITGQDSTVAHAQQSPGSQKGAEPSVQQSESAIPHVQQHLTTGDFTAAIIPVYQQRWFIITAVLCSCVLAVIAFLGLRRKHLAKNHWALQQKQLKQQNRLQFAKLKEAMDTGRTDSFLTICREIIQHHLARLWDMEPSAITLYDLRNREESNSPLVEIFTAAQQHAYGGVHLSKDEMQRFYEVLQKSLEERA